MDHRVDFAERQELVLALVAEKLVHGIRPVDPPAADIPVPQAAASAVERGIDPVAHLLADLVGGARAVRLHHIGDADAEQHDDGGAEQRDMADGARPPAGQNTRQRLHERDLAGRCGKRAHGRDALDAAREPDGHDAGAVGESRQRLRLAEQVDERSRDASRSADGPPGRCRPRRRARGVRLCVSALGGMSAHERVELGRGRVAVGGRRMQRRAWQPTATR